MKLMSLAIAAAAGTLAAGVCQAGPASFFGPIYPTVNHPCVAVPGDRTGKGPEAGFGEMVHFTIGGKVVSVLDKTGPAPRVKFTIETHGEGMGATTGAKYVFDGQLETTADAGSGSNTGAATSATAATAATKAKPAGKPGNNANTSEPEQPLQFDNIYKISARIHSNENSNPARDNATIEFPVKVSYVDGMTVAWPLNAQDNIRLTCQATP